MCRLAVAEYLGLILCLSDSAITAVTIPSNTIVIASTAAASTSTAATAHTTEAVTAASITIAGSTNIAINTSLVTFMVGCMYCCDM